MQSTPLSQDAARRCGESLYFDIPQNFTRALRLDAPRYLSHPLLLRRRSIARAMRAVRGAGHPAEVRHCRERSGSFRLNRQVLKATMAPGTSADRLSMMDRSLRHFLN